MLRRFIAPLTAAAVAIAVGLLIANVASAARAADTEHAQARVAAERSAASVEAELAAYKQRLDEAYAQLAATYGVLESRDAQYASLVGDPSATDGQATVAAAGYAGPASTLVSLAATATPQAATPQAAPATLAAQTPPQTVTPVAAPAATAAPARAAAARYCWYDHEGKYVCEDHPQGK
jgi:hypothetical protein